MLINQSRLTCTEKGLKFREHGNSFELIHVLEEQSRAIETFINCAESDDVRNVYENLYDQTEKSLASLVFEKQTKGQYLRQRMPCLQSTI